MARSILRVLPLCSVLLLAWAEDRTHLNENERRWNTPPELTSEQVAKKSDARNERQRSLTIPITANINLNTGQNAHSLGLQASPGGLSYSESSSIVNPESSSLSKSPSLSLSTGLAGISGVTAHAVGNRNPVNGDRENVNNEALGFDGGAASSSGAFQNGHASSSAASSVDSLHSSATSAAGNGGFSEGEARTLHFPRPNNRQPTWTNIRPNNNNNGYHNSRPPKLHIDVRPENGYNRGPPRLHISTNEPNWGERSPNVQIYKWRPDHISHDFYELSNK